jgi:hypothetical protein
VYSSAIVLEPHKKGANHRIAKR